MKKFLAAVLFMVSSSLTAASLDMNPKRTISVLGEVNGGIVEKANALMVLAGESREPIYILVNSPGGSVRAGNIFISAMLVAKSRGIKIKCVSTIYAASMAFSIMANCNERYALKHTQLLFHPVRVGIMGALTAQELLELGLDLDYMDRELQAFLLETMEMDKDTLLKAYYAEKWWSATEIQGATKDGWIVIVDDVSGVANIFAFKEDGPENKKEKLLGE